MKHRNTLRRNNGKVERGKVYDAVGIPDYVS
jgi:hypothetical protein